jgi:hypothetical protein
VVLAAAARLGSIAAAARHLATAPSDPTVRTALADGLPDRWTLEPRLNRTWAADLPQSLADTRPPLALDLTLRPDPGRPFRDPAEVDRRPARSGTSHFHADATVDLVRPGRRFPRALTWVTEGASLAGVVPRLLRAARGVGVRPRSRLLDRGFCSVDVIRFLPAGRPPFLLPLPLRGRRTDHPAGPSGSRVFAAARRSGWGESTLANAAGGGPSSGCA